MRHKDQTCKETNAHPMLSLKKKRENRFCCFGRAAQKNIRNRVPYQSIVLCGSKTKRL